MWRWALALVGTLGAMQDATAQDMAVCSGLDTEAGCMDTVGCWWNPEFGICRPEDCTAMDMRHHMPEEYMPEECSSIPGCTWDPESATCLNPTNNACSMMVMGSEDEVAACFSIPGCTWDWDNFVCVAKFRSASGGRSSRHQDCPAVEPSMQADHAADASACEAVLGCVYTYGTGEPRCEGGPESPCDGSLDQDACESQGCWYYGSDNTCTRIPCAMFGSDQVSCEHFGCLYTAGISMCEGHCDPALDQNTCESEGCIFMTLAPGECAEPETECAELAHDAMACEATGCMYTPGADDVCEGESADASIACADIAFDPAYCMGMGCTFTHGVPGVCAQRPQCGEYEEDEMGCVAQLGCVWWHVENGPGFCRDDCHTFRDHTSCPGTDNGCFWEDHAGDHSHCAFYIFEPGESSESNSGESSECNDEAVQRLLRLEEEPGICTLRNAEVSCESWVESAIAAGLEMPPGSELLVTGCSHEACEAIDMGWFDDGSQAGTCTYLAHVDTLKSEPPPEYTSWQEARTHCLSSNPRYPSLMWMTETEVSLRAELGRRDWASDAEQMQKDRVFVIDQLRKENAELEKTVEILTGLLQMAKGRRCFGSR
eukprot:COSAG02_NODE_138_length_34440_cov_16.694368_22_plen_600_part_00